jgi:hypothetical protein
MYLVLNEKTESFEGCRSVVDEEKQITVLHNGVLVQHNTEIKGATEYIGLPKFKAHEKGSLRLQDHGDLVSFRNIWIREL